MLKKSTLLFIALMLIKGVSFSQSMRKSGTTPVLTQKFIAPVQAQASGDTLFRVTLPTYYVNPANSANFAINIEDVDGLVPNSASIQENAWGVISSADPADIDPTQGDIDTGYFYAATSWFDPAPGTASNWVTFGPIIVPSAGADLSWRLMVPDPDYRDGYEVLVSTTGGNSGDFTNPAIYSIADQDPGIATTWNNYGVAIDSTMYGNDTIWIAFHHNAVDMYLIFLDNILLKESTSAVVGSNNDECVGATDINSAFGGVLGVEMVMGPYDNDTATTGPQDPTFGFECFGEPDGTGSGPTLENTLWFTFVGDGDIYFIETGNCAGVTNYIDDGDTQIALYAGTCGALTAVDCNEDGPNATATTYPAGLTIATSPGTVYYMIVDGFNFNGAISTGQFCLKITKQAPITCSDPTVTAGTSSQNAMDICWLDTLVATATGALSPNVGDYFGIGWIISSADLAGSNDPLNDPSVLGSYTFTSPAPAISSRSFINDGTFAPVQPGATYYWTPVVFGNATAAVPPAFFGDLTLDSNCTYTGTSLAFNLLALGDPLCSPVTGNNDECAGATDINSALAGVPGVEMTMGPYDNDTATTGPQDPLVGFECFGEPDGTGSAPTLENTLWFTFTGNGLTYFIESGTCAAVTNYIDDGDTQFALYSGTCGALTPVDCNEDGPNATPTTYPAGFNVSTVNGTVYYLMVDGFNFNGAISTGEFCLLITKLTGVGVAENIPGKSTSLVAYPSPAKSNLKIEFMNEVNSDALITVSDNFGRIVQSQSITAQAGLNMTSLNVRSLASGYYIVNVRTNTSSRTVKFVKD